MGNIVSSEDMYIYFIRGVTWKAGVPATDRNQAFNPIVDSIGIKMNPKVYDLLPTANALYPNLHMDKHQEPSTITFRTYFRDPQLLLTMFTYKGVTTVWDGTGDIITGTFTTRTNIDENIGVQIHLRDVSGNCKHLNMFFDGGKVTGYRWIIEEGNALIEEIDIKFAEMALSTYPVDIDMVAGDDESFNATGAAQVSTIVAIAANDLTTGEYFTIQGISAAWVRTNYYVWFNKDAGGGDPTPTGYTAIPVAITTDETAQAVSDLITAAIHGVGNFTAANGGGTSTTITVTNVTQGDIIDIVDVDTGLTVAVTTAGVVGLDGGWSHWDRQLCSTSEKVVLASACTLHVGAAVIPGLHVKRAVMDIAVDKIMEFVASSQTVGISYDKVRTPYKAIFEGILKGNDDIAQAQALLSAKTQATVKFYYDGDTKAKYMEFTLAVLKSIEGLNIPKAGEPIAVTYTYEGVKGSVLTYYWTGDEATDPSLDINHTDI